MKVGETVRVVTLPPYVKTAEPMPMLRPPHVLSVGEEGTVTERRPAGYWGVRFSRGTFLIDSQYIEVVSPTESNSEPTAAETTPETEAGTSAAS